MRRHLYQVEQWKKRQDRRYSRLGRMLVAGLSCVMTVSLLGGCGSNGMASVDIGSGLEGAGHEAGQGSDMGDSMALGRYVERVTDLSGMLDGYREQLFKLPDGKLVITQGANMMQISEDNGASWRQEDYDWLLNVLSEEVIDYYAVGADGTVGIIYSFIEEDTSPEDDGSGNGSDGVEKQEEPESVDGQEADDKQGEAETADQDIETSDDTEEENFRQESGDWLDYFGAQAMIIRPDGTQVSVELPSADNEIPYHIWIKDDGRIFVGTMDTGLYEIAEDGSGQLFLPLADSPQLVQFQGNYLIMDGWGYEGLLIYDMDQGEYIEDEVLNTFVEENYGDRTWNGGSWYDLFFFPGEDDVLYLAGEKGVHRHVIGGSVMEQVVDPGLSSFGNPSYHLLGMTALENNEFAALFQGARLVHFVYDPTVPTVPNEHVKAYSLQDNMMLRQAISIYQTDNPEVYVEYEIGMEEGGAVTRDDALKKLNTQIMAGEGPDLLVLDDMPVDSYIEKGLLKDLAPFVESLNGDEALYDNIVDAFRQDGRLYTIPCEANLPTIMGKEKYISQMKDLEGIADGMEELRRDNPGKDLLMICAPKAIMKNFAPACVPAWTKENGEIDKEAIAEFLTQTKRIYDAQMEDLPEEAIRQYEEVEEDNVTFTGYGLGDQPYYYYSMDEFHYLRDNRQILAGYVGYPYAYAELTSVLKVKGFEEDIIAPINGQSSDVFCVQTLTGLNAMSENTELAEGLLKVLLGPKDITGLGFPVNQAAFESSLYPDDYESPDEIYSTFGYSDGDGHVFTWQIYWFDEQLADALRQRMKTVNTPYVENKVLEEAVYAAGVSYMEGETGIEEAVESVEKNLAIYMAE